jgi:putative ABC transport system substrate-binding protein
MVLLGGAAAAWPEVVRAQQPARLRHIGMLTPIAESDPQAQARVAVFRDTLEKLGWTEGRNVQTHYRWGSGDIPKLAKELIELRAEVVVASGSDAAIALRQQTLSIPIVFVLISDPVAGGLVTNLARPEGNITGFAVSQFSTAGKWLQLIKECSPNISRALVLFDPGNQGWVRYLRVIEAAAPTFGVQLTPAAVREPGEIELQMTAFSREPNGSLIVLPSAVSTSQRERIISLAATYRLPAIYPSRFFAASGGLMSYGNDNIDQYRQAASYVDRILKGAKPAELPVQEATKFEFVINLKTAKALGITIPPTLLAQADYVIE